MDKDRGLFNDFPGINREQWDEKIIKDLKGAPYEKLIWKSPEGFNIKPYYLPEDLEGLEYLDGYPGQFPYNRSNKTQLNDWEIRENIYVDDIEVANKQALRVLDKGATSLNFILSPKAFPSYHDFLHLMKDIYYECIHINFKMEEGAEKIVRYLERITAEHSIAGEKILGSVNMDPLEMLASGKIDKAKCNELIEKLEGIIRESSEKFPFLRVLSVNGSVFHNAGANIVQQIAFSLSMVSEYLDQLGSRGLTVDQSAVNFHINTTTGSQYFSEIAGIRALRLLYANLVNAWKPEKERSERCFIHCSTSEWNQTVYDPYVNMLRGTTQGMSAAIGGADSLTIIPFDASFRESSKFSERIARNTQIILKEEAQLDKVVDPSAGSYFIENLTHSIAEKAWELFLTVEKKGGFIKALETGFIQSIIQETADNSKKGISAGKVVFTGTNKYANPEERLTDDFNERKAFPVKESSNGIVPLIPFRGAEEFEKLRIRVENSPKSPVVFLLTFGDLNWRKARAGFSWGFFAAAGYRIIENLGFDSVKEGMQKAEEQNADIIVLCSKDDEYPAIFPEAASATTEAKAIVIAGYPKDHIEALTSAGAEHFIHVKSNLLEELRKFNRILGID